MTQTEITDQMIESAILKWEGKGLSGVANDLGVEKKRVNKVWDAIANRARELIADGRTNDEIIEGTGLPVRAIAAFRAAMTRAQHTEKRREEEETDDAIEVTNQLYVCCPGADIDGVMRRLKAVPVGHTFRDYMSHTRTRENRCIGVLSICLH